MHPFENLPIKENSIGIHWFGQSSFAIQDSSGTIIQIDPYFPHDRPQDRFIHQRPPLNEASLRTDFILLTHNHGDHTCIESISRVHASYPDVRFAGPKESIQALSEAGIVPSDTQTVTAGSVVEMGSMKAHTVWAKPPNGMPKDNIAPPDVTHLGYVIESDSIRVYISGDPINTFGEHESLLDPIKALKPDIGLLTTHPDEGEFPFFEGSAQIAVKLGLKAAVPAHYSCFVSRNYDPLLWASQLKNVAPLIIPYNQSIIYPDEN